MSEEEKKEYEEAKLYLEHTGVDDFNLEKHQCENRKWAIETALKIIEKQEKEIESIKNCCEIKEIELKENAEIIKKQEKVIEETKQNKFSYEDWVMRTKISKDKIKEKIGKKMQDNNNIIHDGKKKWGGDYLYYEDVRTARFLNSKYKEILLELLEEGE